MNNRKTEILAPAGGLEQARAALAEHCDAIYGGLKKWGARNRAANFTLEEYHEILTECHEHGARFYLTLNTLVTDDELHEIEVLFADDGFVLPDAVIVADIGLMRMLHNKFPAVEIHASTQFGACSVDDIRFLETLGVKRAVLARELSLDEITAIRNSTDMELEVFTYGSQCVCFSGQCLWGGLVNGSSGNRGRCIGMCRDTYRTMNGTLGQYMYPRDIDLSPMAAQLSQLGIDSLKIEGRLRNSQEIAQTVRKFRAALDGASQEKEYYGWVTGKPPVKGMFSAVNPRLKFSGESSECYGEHDMVYSETPRPLIHAGNTGSADKYLFTSFCHPLERGSINISVKMKFVERKLHKLDFINTFGERKLFDVQSNATVPMTASAAAEYVRSRVGYPIYELLADVPENETVQVDKEELDSLISQINAVCAAQDSGSRTAADFSDRYEDITAQTDSASDIPVFRGKGIRKIVFELSTLSELREALALDTGDIVYKLPAVDFTGRLNEMLPLLHGKRVMVARASQLLFAEEYGFSEVTADYTLNVWNSSSAALLKSHGVTGMTAHPEMSAKESEMIAQSAGLGLSVIRKGKIPLGYMRGCWGESGACSRNCGSSFELENVTKGYGITISCGGEFGFRRLWRAGTDVTDSCTDSAEKRYVFTGIPHEERMELFRTAHNANVICAANVR